MKALLALFTQEASSRDRRATSVMSSILILWAGGPYPRELRHQGIGYLHEFTNCMLACLEGFFWLFLPWGQDLQPRPVVVLSIALSIAEYVSGVGHGSFFLILKDHCHVLPLFPTLMPRAPSYGISETLGEKRHIYTMAAYLKRRLPRCWMLRHIPNRRLLVSLDFLKRNVKPMVVLMTDIFDWL